jgi:UDP-N-acetylglucosamine 4-epimerase
VGCGEKTSINELSKIMNTSPPIYLKQRFGDVPCSQADISKAKNILGYNPRVKITEGLEKTINWYLKNN